jgi:hypothetical protein
VADVVKKDEEFSGTRPVEERQRFDELRLDAWMRENVEGYLRPGRRRHPHAGGDCDAAAC